MRPATVPESGMTQAPYYHATLCLHGSLIVTKDDQRGGIKVAVGLGDRQVPVGVKKRLAVLLQDKPPEGEQGVIVWPRTDKEGHLGSGTQLFTVGEVKPPYPSGQMTILSYPPGRLHLASHRGAVS